MRTELARIAMATLLLTTPGALVACDREDRADVREGVNDADRQIDKLDTDGKDD